MEMNEEFLQHIWQYSLFQQNNLKTENGDSIEICKPGEHNFDSGPDFFNAKIIINKLEWAGNVEIHTYSSDWDKHNHQLDKAYRNIILHVVYYNDKPLLNRQEIPVPTLVLNGLVDKKLIQKFEALKLSVEWIPCEKTIHKVPEFICSSWLERLLVERLEAKSKLIIDTLQLNNNNWEESFYQHLAKNFGFKINAVPFELLAKSIPNFTLAKHKNSLLQLEAMLFGCAGFLEKQFNDKYLQSLQNEYQFLKTKFSLKPMEEHLWKFLRLRPANFPTIRLAQFAALIYRSEHLFSKVLETDSLKSLLNFLNVPVSEYWTTHYVQEKKSNFKRKVMGKMAAENLIINTIIPFLFVYGKQKKESKFVDRALSFLEQTAPEKNQIIYHFQSLGIKANNAFRTQALLQLKNEHCHFKKCLNCAIGNNLLKN